MRSVLWGDELLYHNYTYYACHDRASGTGVHAGKTKKKLKKNKALLDFMQFLKVAEVFECRMR